MPRVSVSLRGSPRDWVGRVEAVAARAVYAGVDAATQGATLALRQHVAQAGLGDRLPNAIRSRTYPDRKKASLAAAGTIWARPRAGGRVGADTILNAHTTGARITAKGGRWLAIPTGAFGRGPRGARLTPKDLTAKGVRLRFLPTGAGRAVLIAEEARYSEKRARFIGGAKRTKTGRHRKGAASAVAFVLVRATKLAARLRPAQVVEAHAARIPALIGRSLPKE